MKQIISLFILFAGVYAGAAAGSKPVRATASVLDATAEDDSGDAVALSIGRSMLWPVAIRGSISVSNGAVIHVVDEGSVVRISALKLGTSIVRIGLRKLEVNIVPEASYRIFDSLHRAIENRRGLKISAESGALRVSGRLLRASDWMALAAAVPAAPVSSYVFSAVVDADAMKAVRATLQERLRTVGISSAEFRFTPDVVATVGLGKDERERAEKALAPFGVRVEANSSVLGLEPLVRVKILVAEIKKSFLRRYGVQWPASITGVLMPDLSLGLQPAEFGVDALEQNGWGRVLASPNLLCRSGKEAEFMAGGEFPIKVSSYRSNEVIWKSYGVRLHVKPVADVAGRMSIAIETEVSELDDSHKTADNIPGIYTNKMQTHFDLTKSRTIALSGLIKSGQSNHSSGLPGLGSLPILGPLFSSKEFKDEQSELVIFVTPEVLKADDDKLEKNP
jgi:pilus assembly protein CpaC